MLFKSSLNKTKYLLSAAICFHSNTKCTTRIRSGHAPSHGREITHRTLCTYIQKNYYEFQRDEEEFLQTSANYPDRFLLPGCIATVCKTCKGKVTAAPLALNSWSLSYRELHRNSPPAVQLPCSHRPEHRPEMCTEYPETLSPRPHPGISLESCRVIRVLDGRLLTMELPGDAELN